jgi:plasmid stabilization system protein ParE
MKFQVNELRKAQADIRHIVNWLAERSSKGARAWLDAYDSMVARVSLNATSMGPADENDAFDIDVRQALFKTPRGRVYRALFLIQGEEVLILRVRGPGQAPVRPEELK